MIIGKHRVSVGITLGAAIALTFLLSDCSKPPEARTNSPSTKPESGQTSTIRVDLKEGGPIILTTSAAEFQVRPDGYVQASLLSDGKKLSLDEPNAGTSGDSDFARVAGKDMHFNLDFQRSQVREATGKMGAGKRIEIPARPLETKGTGLQAVLALEVYDNFPNLVLSTMEYKNAGTTDVTLEKSVNQRRRLNAQLEDAKAKPWEMWSFHGASYDWGKDDVLKLTPAFSQPNVMGEMVKGGYGGGIPVVAFWTRQVGEAIG